MKRPIFFFKPYLKPFNKAKVCVLLISIFFSTVSIGQTTTGTISPAVIDDGNGACNSQTGEYVFQEVTGQSWTNQSIVNGNSAPLEVCIQIDNVVQTNAVHIILGLVDAINGGYVGAEILWTGTLYGGLDGDSISTSINTCWNQGIPSESFDGVFDGEDFGNWMGESLTDPNLVWSIFVQDASCTIDGTNTGTGLLNACSVTFGDPTFNCTPSDFTAVPNCNGSQTDFVVDFIFVDEGTASSITDFMGNSIPLTGLNNYSLGPYPNNSIVNFLVDDADNSCDIQVSSLTLDCAPCNPAIFTATAQCIGWATTFMVAVDFADEATSTSVSDNMGTTLPLNGAGLYNFGPYPNGTIVDIFVDDPINICDTQQLGITEDCTPITCDSTFTIIQDSLTGAVSVWPNDYMQNGTYFFDTGNGNLLSFTWPDTLVYFYADTGSYGLCLQTFCDPSSQPILVCETTTILYSLGTVGIENPAFDEIQFQILGNPVVDQLRLSIDLPKPEELRFEIYDFAGKVLYKENHWIGPGIEQFVIEDIEISTGVYFLSFVLENGARKSVRFLKE